MTRPAGASGVGPGVASGDGPGAAVGTGGVAMVDDGPDRDRVDTALGVSVAVDAVSGRWSGAFCRRPAVMIPQLS